MNQHTSDFRCYMLQTALTILGIVLSVPVLAQSPDATQAPSSAPDNLVQSGGRDGELRPAARAPLSSVPWFLQDMRNSAGFSLGMYGSYAPRGEITALGQDAGPRKYGWLTPQLFANVRRRHTQIFLDYTFQYRAYSGRGQLGGNSHIATVQVERTISPNVSLQFGNAFTSSVNDRVTFLTPIPFAAHEEIVAQDLDVPLQRVTWNSLSTRLNYQMSRKNNVSVFGQYDFWQYSNLNLGRNHGILVGVQSRYQVNKWLFLDNSYSHYINAVDNPARGNATQIHRLQVGGLRFARSRGGFEASLSGGMDLTSIGGRPQPAPSVQGGLSRAWDSGGFSLFYRRGLWTAVGPGNVVEGNSVTASFNQFLRRLNFNVGSSYHRGSTSWNTAGNSAVNFVTGNAGLGIAVQRHVLLSLDYAYVSQRVANLSTDIRNVSRSSMGVGINYYLPSLFNRDRDSRFHRD